VNGPVIGWDVGGANVKAAFLADAASRPRIVERPFALWRDPAGLPDVLSEIAKARPGAGLMAVTMTAELCDCYATKREGVSGVLDAFAAAFPEARVRVFGVDGRFRSPASARRRPLRVAAANWMASALLVAETHPDALFVDVGSTTTDVIPIQGGRVTPRGRTDPARLRSGELVYTGVLRTPVCAIVRSLPLRGRRCRVAAELFAIAADAHLWLGHIAEEDYTCETPDGRGKSRAESGARLARMVCSDSESLSAAEITAIAERMDRAQELQIVSGISQVQKRFGIGGPRLAVLAGRGAFLAERAARFLDLETWSLEERLGPEAARAAPAAAVAWLLARDA
jgi:probable H4MPT-linked C1 transfer pathway protein